MELERFVFFGCGGMVIDIYLRILKGKKLVEWFGIVKEGLRFEK